MVLIGLHILVASQTRRWMDRFPGSTVFRVRLFELSPLPQCRVVVCLSTSPGQTASLQNIPLNAMMQ